MWLIAVLSVHVVTCTEVIGCMLSGCHDNRCRWLHRAKKDFDENTETCFDFDTFCASLDKKKLVLAPFCGDIPCEDNIKKLSARYTTCCLWCILYIVCQSRTELLKWCVCMADRQSKADHQSVADRRTLLLDSMATVGSTQNLLELLSWWFSLFTLLAGFCCKLWILCDTELLLSNPYILLSLNFTTFIHFLRI